MNLCKAGNAINAGEFESGKGLETMEECAQEMEMPKDKFLWILFGCLNPDFSKVMQITQLVKKEEAEKQQQQKEEAEKERAEEKEEEEKEQEEQQKVVEPPKAKANDNVHQQAEEKHEPPPSPKGYVV